MTKDRQLVVMAVLEGKLPVSMITEKELDELHEAVFDAVASTDKASSAVSSAAFPIYAVEYNTDATLDADASAAMVIVKSAVTVVVKVATE